jgi:hypothetical protein
MVEAYFSKPTTGGVDITMHRADTDAELANPVTVLSADQVVQKQYEVPARVRKYYFKVTLTGDGASTPTLSTIRLFRDAQTESPTRTSQTLPVGPNELSQTDIESVSVTGPTQDAGSNNATFTIWDYTGAMSSLKTQSLQPVKIETEYDGVPNKTAIFEGYVRQAKYHRKGSSNMDGVYPDKTQGRLTVQCVGEWRRLAETLAPQRFTWRDANNKGLPRKVDDVLSLLFHSAGFADSEIDLPGSELRLWGSGDSSFMMDVATPIAPFMQEVVRDFYGGHILYDPSAGSAGMWRVLPQKAAPYNILARFETETAGEVKTRVSGAHSDVLLDHMSEAYGTAVTTSPLGNSQNTIRTFIQRDTLDEWIEPPEGNSVYVAGMIGASEGGCDGSEVKSARQFDQLLINFDSFNALNLGTGHAEYPVATHADYIGRSVPIHYYDARLSSQEAVNFVARRIFDYSCHARKHMTFKAPLILVTDADDAQQQRPRPLRYYDIVEVWNHTTSAYEKFIVESVDIAYSHDNVQMATYHLVQSSIMATKAANTNSLADRPYYVSGKLKNAREGRSGPASGHWEAKKEQVMQNLTDIVQLPNPSEVLISGADPVQDTDPASGTFGDFAWIDGIDSFL